MVPNRCVVCGSERIIPGATILDQGNSSSGEMTIAISANPNAIVFKDTVSRRLRAAVCGDCGHVELSVEDPRALYGAYLRNIAATRQRS